jgi:DNA/RNA-binding domain of Phe-tRNA-synthetase-like protein
MITVSDSFRARHPGARVGFLAMTGAANPASSTVLDARKAEIEGELRTRYAGFDRKRLKEIPVIRAYDGYYKRFDKSYHVLLQLESVALKGKPFPRVAALVEAMFMAEISNLILTAGHDLTGIAEPLVLDAAAGSESYTGIGGREIICAAGDMMIRDSSGVVSSVIYGPDFRTRIVLETASVLFTAYAPEGVGEEAVRGHLRDLEALVRLISPEAKTMEKGLA